MRVRYHRTFDKKFKKLKFSIQEKFKERRNIFLSDQFHPLLDNHPLHPPCVGSRSINVTGDYRAIFKQASPDLVIFTDIGTHYQLFGT